MSSRNDLYFFFDRPTEPCFMQKGDEKAIFEIPDHYYPEKYKKQSSSLANRFGANSGRTIPVRNIALPDLTVPMSLPQNDQFSLFVPRHRELAGKLIDIFMGMRDVDDLKSVCAFCQLRINPYMFNYCLSVAMLHRPDTKGMTIPTLAETFPDKFVDPKVFRRAREISNVVPTGTRLPITIPQNYTASDAEPEQRLAYFREDIGINLHHWHWHLVYPFDAADMSIVNKNRRGELFYYMHNQIVARYSSARFCEDLKQINRFNDFRAPIAEAYFPKMDSIVASRTWPPRCADTTVRDVDRPVDQIKIDISQLEIWRDRFIQAIESNSVMLSNGRTVPLDEQTGIDILGNMMESSIVSINRGFYGDLHNMGHIVISYCHDPDHRHLEQFGVMGDSTTAMRDPIFYRWHSYVDDIFQMYKSKLRPYGRDALDYPGIRVSSIGTEGPSGKNIIGTFWEQNTLELARGLDFTPRGSVLATFTHLQHDPINYVINATNTSGQSVMGTFRIFIAPVNDQDGRPLKFPEQRRFMIELDKFTRQLRPGNNTIRQSSASSSVTIPFERTFRNQADRPGADPATSPGSAEAAEFDFCGCGWPDHMLYPKGTPSGYRMVLFVMVSNWADDRIEQDLVGSCNDASSFCGIKDRLYPDRRAMGFPFDRPAGDNVRNLSDFLYPNMTTQECRIRFTDEVRQRPQRR